MLCLRCYACIATLVLLSRAVRDAILRLRAEDYACDALVVHVMLRLRCSTCDVLLAMLCHACDATLAMLCL